MPRSATWPKRTDTDSMDPLEAILRGEKMAVDYTKLKVAEKPYGNPPEAQPPGRKCRLCGSKLNLYNKTDLCSPCRRMTAPGKPKPLSGGQANKEFNTK